MQREYRHPDFLATGIENWLNKKLSDSGRRGCVVGLSGGIDSAVVAAILKKVCGKQNMLGVLMPCHSNPRDAEDAALVAEALDIPTMTVDISSIYDEFLAVLGDSTPDSSNMAFANIKPRLRMSVLYFIAQKEGFLVCGTGNRAELTIGYFTKFGDSGADLLPLGDLLKGEVRSLASWYGVPQPIIDKPPSAGLWPGQTDEKEIGLSYDQIDMYLLRGEGAPETIELIEHAREHSNHKRTTPEICSVCEQPYNGSDA